MLFIGFLCISAGIENAKTRAALLRIAFAEITGCGWNRLVLCANGIVENDNAQLFARGGAFLLTAVVFR
jgi:hypothetical protein